MGNTNSRFNTRKYVENCVSGIVRVVLYKRPSAAEINPFVYQIRIQWLCCIQLQDGRIRQPGLLTASCERLYGKTSQRNRI